RCRGICEREGLPYQLIPYFISSHPGCTEGDMRELAEITKRLNFRLEQVQDLTPTPMTLSSVMFYTGIDPYTGEKLYVARTREEKARQKAHFFWYKRPAGAARQGGGVKKRNERPWQNTTKRPRRKPGR
ncbi:MAG: DUF3362 domain-containing protein, partial [Rikenella sp.]|nr:DUF3362 domain-containing protein [Rikenella sp.]